MKPVTEEDVVLANVLWGLGQCHPDFIVWVMDRHNWGEQIHLNKSDPEIALRKLPGVDSKFTLTRLVEDAEGCWNFIDYEEKYDGR